MFIARILYPVKTLGPGKRLGIWFSGCEHHCKGCSNPELWEQPEKFRISLNALMKMINAIAKENLIDGFTLSGGDPFYQPDALTELLPELNKVSKDILVYTGYFYDEIYKKYPEILKQIAVLIDAPYVDNLNYGEILRGSINQNIIILKQEYKNLYDEYRNDNQNIIQNFTTSTGIASVGIHRQGYNKELEKRLQKRGLKKYYG